MRRIGMTALLALCCAAALNAQSPAALPNSDSAAEFASTSGQTTVFESPNTTWPTGSYTSANLARRVHTAAETFPSFSASGPGPMLLSTRNDTSVAIPAEPVPDSTPRLAAGDDYRWELGVGFAWERFRSSVFNASAVGMNTSVSYLTNDWFAVEGSVSSTFAPSLAQIGKVRFLNYGVGPKIFWQQHTWAPFLHVLAGGTHALPQTAAGGQNAFMVSPGGGADWRWLPRLSVRLEADYVRTSLYSQHQNNFQLVAGLVFHF